MGAGAGAAAAGGLASGAASSLFGKGSSAPNTSGLLKQYTEALKMSLDLAKNPGKGSAGLRSVDDQALAAYKKSAMEDGMAMLGNYDASAAAAGSGINKMDSAKDFQRSNIAGQVSRDIGSKQLSLYSSEPERMAGLIPNPAGAGSAAQFVDTSNQNAGFQNMQAAQGIAGAIPWGSIFGGGKNSQAGAVDPYLPGSTVGRGGVAYGG